MNALEVILAELKDLPPDKLAEAMGYIRRLKEVPEAERLAALRDTAGSLTREEADDWERRINEDCERVDERDW